MIIPKCIRISRMFDIDPICRVIGIGISSITFPRETLSLYNMYTKLYIIYCSVIKLKYSTLLIWLFSYSSLSNDVQLLSLPTFIFVFFFFFHYPSIFPRFIYKFIFKTTTPLLWFFTRWIKVLIVSLNIFLPFQYVKIT